MAAAIGISAMADNSKYVNLFMGTAGDHGQVAPAAQVPFGLASVCPDSKVPQHSGYDYDMAEISGISITRTSGTGGNGGGGNVSVLPGLPDTGIAIVKGTEKAVPGSYEALLNNGVSVSLTASSNIAFERYSFPKGAQRILYINFDSAIDHRRSSCSFSLKGSDRIEGTVSSSTVCNFGRYTLHFTLGTSAPFEVAASDDKTATLRFSDDVDMLEVRIAISPVDIQSSARELASFAGRSFRSVRKDAAASWKRLLSRVDVEGSTEEQKVLFYTSMYRVFLSPYKASLEGRYMGTDGKEYKCPDWTFYNGWSMWDTYRTKFPMIAIMAPEEMSDICRSLVSLYCTGKKNWATMNECTPTVRTEHSLVTLLDAWEKGIRGFDMALAFPGMEKEHADGLVKGSKQGLTRNAPDQMVETTYDIWAMSRIAGIIGNEEARQKYAAEADSLFDVVWKREFMTITDRFTLMKGNGMYQGTRWQYRWALPQYAEQMKALVPARDLDAQLSEFFARHLFNQGNEPDIQTPFMFNLFGHPERTDSLVHALVTDDSMIHLYGGNAEYPEPFVGRAFQNKTDGYAPEMDEDDGTMSAWYMFCQMGFYPLCVGTDRYELFTPLFSKIKMNLPGRKLTIRRLCPEGRPGRIYIDGKALDGRTVTHSQLFDAHEITFR